jgi:magnesium-transporting ATPase (P-type)
MPEAIKVSVSDNSAMQNGSMPTKADIQALMPQDSGPQACEEARVKFFTSYPKGSEELAKKLGSDPHSGLDDTEEQIQHRRETFGHNWFEERALRSYMSFLLEALQDQVIILLLVMATILLLVEGFLGEHRRRLAEEETDCWLPGPLCSTWWMESAAIYLSCTIITNFVAGSDWKKERMFAELQRSLETSNKKTIVRKGESLEVTDRDIVVGDVVLFNAHNMSVLPTDGVVLSTKDVKVDESALTGEPDPLQKDQDEHPFLFAGTVCTSGSGRMLVTSVGQATVSGRIKMAVYADEEEQKSPLFEKLDTLAGQIGKGGSVVAVVCFLIMCVNGFLVPFVKGDEEIADLQDAIRYVITAITILAVAVPEGLPLAVNLSLLLTSITLSKKK